MKRKNVTRSALFTSIISLLLCVSMLVGTTFAWFTDSVESGRNVIAAGYLDVELTHSNDNVKNDDVAGETELFKDVKLWEPGAVAYETLTVTNAGNLALKYNLDLTVLEETVTADDYKLSDVIMAGVIEGELSANTTRKGLVDAVTDWTPINAFSLKQNGVQLDVGGSDSFTVVLYWQPNSNEIDNRYNMNNENKGETLTLEVGVNLYATQVEAESDSFGEDYDSAAKVPGSTTSTTRTPVNSDGSVSLTVINAPAVDTKRTTVDAPAGAFNAGDEVEIVVTTNNTLFNVTNEGATVASVDVDLYVNEVQKTDSLADGKIYTVTTYISKGLTDVKVFYGTTEHNSDYDYETGKLVFTTDHFSAYTVTGKALAYDAKNDTAVNDVETIVEAAKDPESTVVVPNENKQTVSNEIEQAVQNGTITEADKNVINSNLINAAKIGDTTYATLAEAFAAAKDNDTIVVLNNVELDQMISNNKNITLDLNGKTIYGVDNTTKNFSLIDNRGQLTITGNGTMTLKATVNSGWNRYSAVLANNPGGKLVVENGTIEHLGGTDMAYGIDNLTNGDGTYAETVINGGTVKSTYRGIRQFLNGNNANNILTVNGGTIEGTNKSIWMQGPTNKKPCSGKLTVAEKATLNGDVYLFVTAGSTEWPVTVSIAANAVNGEVISGNVPAGYLVCKVDEKWTVLGKEGLAEALAQGGNIVLASDIALANDEILNVTGNAVIDLNGHTISGMATTSTTSYMIKVAPGAELTLKGSGKVSFYATTPDTEWGGEGQPPFPGYANNTIRCEGKLVIDGVTVENRTAAGGASYAIDCYQGSDLIINSGVIDGMGKCAIRMFCNSNTLSTNVTVNGGTITGKRAIWVQLPGSNIANVRPVNLTIKGGKLICTNTEEDVCVYSYSYGDSFANTNITITGGEFTGDVCFGGGNAKTTQENVTITGGIFNGELGRYLANDGWEEIAKP